MVSPQRVSRPWQGEGLTEPLVAPSFDPQCYLCPGNVRANGQRNPDYSGTFAFDNDFPALLPDAGSYPATSPGLLTAQSERGACRVLCFSPRHDLTLGRMRTDAIRGVVDAWCEETARLGALPYIGSVQIFENRGLIMGASNPHPHGQIWANESVPTEVLKELDCQVHYLEEHGHCLLCDYAALEASLGERVIFDNQSFAVVVPFWAIWPFETMVIAKRHTGSLEELTAAEREDLAKVLKRVTTRYDNLFETPFPYSFGIHQRPCDGHPHDSWHLHAHFYPPLLRSATVRKFLVGYEMLAMPQRDITAEAAAERLRRMSEVHYLDRQA